MNHLISMLYKISFTHDTQLRTTNNDIFSNKFIIINMIFLGIAMIP